MKLSEYLKTTRIDLSDFKSGMITFDVYKSAHIGLNVYTKTVEFLCKNLGLEEPSASLSDLITLDDNYLGLDLVRSIITVDTESDNLRLSFKVVVR